MARAARVLSETGFYHVIFRGINHQNIFEEEEDFEYILGVIQELKQEMQFEVHAYCLMINHVHILLKEKHVGDISSIMKRLLVKYVMRFNKKYQRCGALIGSRYKSKAVAVDEYYVPLIVYIHQNPLRAGIVSRLEDYKYSSYGEYIGNRKFIDTELAMGMLGKEEWIKVHQHAIEKEFEIDGRKKLSEKEVWEKILKETENIDVRKIGTMEKAERDKLLRKFRGAGLSIREIERATGISRGIIAKVDKNLLTKINRFPKII